MGGPCKRGLGLLQSFFPQSYKAGLELILVKCIWLFLEVGKVLFVGPFNKSLLFGVYFGAPDFLAAPKADTSRSASMCTTRTGPGILLFQPEAGAPPKHGRCYRVAVKGLKSSYHNSETILSTLYPYSGNLN